MNDFNHINCKTNTESSRYSNFQNYSKLQMTSENKVSCLTNSSVISFMICSEPNNLHLGLINNDNDMNKTLTVEEISEKSDNLVKIRDSLDSHPKESALDSLFGIKERISRHNSSCTEKDFTSPKFEQSSEKYNQGRWNVDEHRKFLEAMYLHGNEWKKVQKYIGTRSSTQARSHAQKFFMRLKKRFGCENLDNEEKREKKSEKILKWIIREYISSNVVEMSNKILRDENKSEDKPRKLYSVIMNLMNSNNNQKSKKKKLLSSQSIESNEVQTNENKNQIIENTNFIMNDSSENFDLSDDIDSPADKISKNNNDILQHNHQYLNTATNEKDEYTRNFKKHHKKIKIPIAPEDFIDNIYNINELRNEDVVERKNKIKQKKTQIFRITKLNKKKQNKIAVSPYLSINNFDDNPIETKNVSNNINGNNVYNPSHFINIVNINIDNINNNTNKQINSLNLSRSSDNVKENINSFIDNASKNIKHSINTRNNYNNGQGMLDSNNNNNIYNPSYNNIKNVNNINTLNNSNNLKFNQQLLNNFNSLNNADNSKVNESNKIFSLYEKEFLLKNLISQKMLCYLLQNERNFSPDQLNFPPMSNANYNISNYNNHLSNKTSIVDNTSIHNYYVSSIPDINTQPSRLESNIKANGNIFDLNFDEGCNIPIIQSQRDDDILSCNKDLLNFNTCENNFDLNDYFKYDN